MNIAEFFQQSEGKWFSQRTTHDLTTSQSASGKSDLWVDVVSADDAAVVELCQKANADPTALEVAVRVRWQGEFGSEAKAESGSTLMVAIASSSSEGTLLCQDGKPGAPFTQSHYSLGSDDALTLTTNQDSLSAEERIWYASPALRFRTSTIKYADGFSTASFCSEIRMGGAKPAANQQATAQA